MPAKTKKKTQEAQNPLILRAHRLMEAFAKSNDERDFYLDSLEGFIIYINLDNSKEELTALEGELEKNPDRYCMIPKLTFYETKKIMEGFVNEKVYDIDTKEKLLDIIHSKEARENFLEFIYDHHNELEKWQQYYQERSRIRIIEWLRHHHFHFVFEEDLELSTSVLETLKKSLFTKKVDRDIDVARKSLFVKAKTYYSNEALNPRPKRGRPPKQAQKLEMEPQLSTDIYTTVPSAAHPFLFTPEITSALDVTFSSRFETGEELLAQRRGAGGPKLDESLNNISKKLATLQQLSSRWMESETQDRIAEEQVEAPRGSDLADLNDEERLLFKKLDSRKKAVHARKTTSVKPTTTAPKANKPSPPKKAAKKPTQPKTTPKKPIPKKKPTKRIMNVAKVPAKKAKPKAKAAPATKAAKTPAKRPVRRITPKQAPAPKKTTPKAKKKK